MALIYTDEVIGISEFLCGLSNGPEINCTKSPSPWYPCNPWLLT